MKRTAALILVLLMLAVSPAALAVPDYNPAGHSVGGFSSITLSGQSIDGNVFSDYGVSIVTYWATWSADCRNQMAILQQIHEEHPEYGVFGLLHVDGTSTAKAARDFMNDNGYTFTVFVVDRVWKKIVEATPFIPQSFIVSSNALIVEAWVAAFQSAEQPLEMLEFWYCVSPWSGDIDLNGSVTSADALYALRTALKLIEITDRQLICGDVNHDWKINTEDALRIMRSTMDLKGG